MLANSTGAAEQTPDSEHDEQLLLPHKLDENMKALEEYHLLQHDEFVKTVNKNADECEKLYAEIMGVVHRYVPQSLSGVGLQSTRDSNVMASRMVTRFAKIMNNAAKVCASGCPVRAQSLSRNLFGARRPHTSSKPRISSMQ
eukprot:SAG31_NODE_270_length_18732_cov_9.342618_2_plen_142_part_00